jgi:hypothetical protein
MPFAAVHESESVTSLQQALSLGLRIADGVGEHLAKLSLRLVRFARDGFLPLRSWVVCGDI